MKYIKLMADYGCFPLWENSSTNVGNIDPNALPISDSLKEDLYEWSLRYDETLNKDDPLQSGFLSDADEQSFNRDGLAILEKLQSELGENYNVTAQI